MSYPLKYGYSLVGRVAKCGAGVDPNQFLGKLVFSFSPHSSWVVADADGVMLVPEVTQFTIAAVCFMALFGAFPHFVCSVGRVFLFVIDLSPPLRLMVFVEVLARER